MDPASVEDPTPTPAPTPPQRTPATSADLLQRAAEQSFGGLWDALGLAPLREFQQCVRRLAGASASETVALTDCWRIAAYASLDGLQGMTRALSERARNGDAVKSPFALLRVWQQELDAATQARLLSDAGLAATSSMVRAGAQRRIAQQHLIGLCSQAIGLPTREETDEAFREIQRLKRELRHLKRALNQEKDGA
jgi:hypothetical protein